jgi:hypothetical protein
MVIKFDPRDLGFDDCVLMLPYEDEQGRQISRKEFQFLITCWPKIRSSDQEEINEKAWEALRWYRSNGGDAEIEIHWKGNNVDMRF